MRVDTHRPARFLFPGAISALALSAAVAAFVALAILTYRHSEAVHRPSAENVLLHLFFEGANFGVALSYFAIAALIFRGLWRQGRAARSNHLGITAGLIFITCSAGHLIHVGLAHLSGTAIADGLLVAQVGADVAALVVAGVFFAGQYAELLDPSVGPAIRREAGAFYVLMSWSGLFFVLAGAVIGLVLRRRIHAPTKTQ